MEAKVLCQWMWPGVTCLFLSDIGGWLPKRPWKDHLEGVEGSRVSDSRLRGEAPAAPEKRYCALSREGMHLFEFETLSFFVTVAAKIFLQDPISLFTKWGNLPWWPPGQTCKHVRLLPCYFSVLKVLPSRHASFSPQALAWRVDFITETSSGHWEREWKNFLLFPHIFSYIAITILVAFLKINAYLLFQGIQLRGGVQDRWLSW